VDGGEGGTGATFQELQDGVGLPLLTALPIVSGTPPSTVMKLGYLFSFTMVLTSVSMSSTRLTTILNPTGFWPSCCIWKEIK
jgi:hypothetical protein